MSSCSHNKQQVLPVESQRAPVSSSTVTFSEDSRETGAVCTGRSSAAARLTAAALRHCPAGGARLASRLLPCLPSPAGSAETAAREGPLKQGSLRIGGTREVSALVSGRDLLAKPTKASWSRSVHACPWTPGTSSLQSTLPYSVCFPGQPRLRQ